MRLTQTLRDHGIPAEFDLKGRPLGKQVEYASSAHIPYLIVVGPQEIESKRVKLKQMATRTETSVPIDEIATKLRSLN
jgi:histidyl-tRNA synthetase